MASRIILGSFANVEGRSSLGVGRVVELAGSALTRMIGSVPVPPGFLKEPWRAKGKGESERDVD